MKKVAQKMKMMKEPKKAKAAIKHEKAEGKAHFAALKKGIMGMKKGKKK